MKVAEKYPADYILPNAEEVTTFMAGLECEIESIKDIPYVEGFHCIEDGSLRNGGREFVSDPADRETLIKRFKVLHENLTLGDNPFSERTSTHVHINVASLDLNQVRNMIYLYALFEEVFFLMVKPERRDNIHCVPLTETYMPSIYPKGMDHLLGSWHKYTAFNIKRITDLGTIEFRHLHGTNNADELNQWLSALENLWVLSQQESVNRVSLKMENIYRWFEYIFANSPTILAMKPTLIYIIANSLIDVKLSF